MATKIKIQDILQSKGDDRNCKLDLFLNGCSERQRCFLAFVSTNPFLTDASQALSFDDLCKVSASCKDKDKFLGYASFTSAMRDLWLKYEGNRQQMKKALCYYTALYAKRQDAIDAVEACNKALSYIPEEHRQQAGEAMAASLDKGETISMESDVFGIGVCYDPEKGLLVADVEDADIIIKDSWWIYEEFVSSVKAYEAVFTELSQSKTVGKDGDAIFKPLLHSFEQLKSKEAFSVYAYIPPYEEMRMAKIDYDNVKNNVVEWIENKS